MCSIIITDKEPKATVSNAETICIFEMISPEDVKPPDNVPPVRGMHRHQRLLVCFSCYILFAILRIICAIKYIDKLRISESTGTLVVVAVVMRIV